MVQFLFGVVVAILVLTFPGIAATQGRNESQRHAKQNLWAAMAVQQPVCPKNRINDLTLTFAIVNDGNSTVNPAVPSSHLFINGVELEQWRFISSNGPRTSSFTALPSKRTFLFSCGCGEYFPEGGCLHRAMAGRAFHSTGSHVQSASRRSLRTLPKHHPATHFGPTTA